MEMEIVVAPLHHHKEYTNACCKLINEEWKRSDTARMRSLEASSDSLPTNLILLKTRELIGHLKLSPIPSIKDSCFVESVVIAKKLRGKGYGRILMKKAEDYCNNFLQLKTIYLSTKGQEGFYTKLGYMECQPISIYGGCTFKASTDYVNNHNKHMNKISRNAEVEIGVPKPPPLPPIKSNTNNTKSYMMKIL